VDGEREVKAFWALRNRGVGLLGNMAGPRRPVPFVEDCAVPPARLGEFVNDLRAVLDQHGLAYGMYGHVDVGCLHVRPALDLQNPSDLRQLRAISDRVFQLVRNYGGVFWGEHGKGLRSEYNPEVFGPVLYQQIRRIKHAFDPYNQMNPGKIATPSAVDEDLARLESPTRGQRDRDIAAEAQAEFETAIACNGNGACFSWDVDYVMCPSMKATADRIHSPKGRATLIREWLRQLAFHGVRSLPSAAPQSWRDSLSPARRLRRAKAAEDFSGEVFEALAGCLSCKACVAQCPVHVDIPEFKSKFLDAYHRRYRRPVADYLVAAMESALPRLPQAALPQLARLGASAVRAFGLIDSPAVAPRPAEQILSAGGAEMVDWSWRAAGAERVVALVPDVFTNYFDPSPFLAMYELARASGVRTVVLPYRASGKAQHIKGFLAQFEKIAAPLAKDLSSMIESGVELVCVEPAVALYFRQECSRFAGGLAGPRAVALPQEWLSGAPPLTDLAGSDRSYTLLGHCTESTTAALAHRLWKDVFAASNARVEIVAVGCCGMAGAFGHEAAHVGESRRIFDTSWRKRVEGTNRKSILATGYSCREQVTRFAGFRPRHPLEVLRDAMGASA
jgi:Fe-S oxidoreductase